MVTRSPARSQISLVKHPEMRSTGSSGPWPPGEIAGEGLVFGIINAEHYLTGYLRILYYVISKDILFKKKLILS